MELDMNNVEAIDSLEWNLSADYNLDAPDGSDDTDEMPEGYGHSV